MIPAVLFATLFVSSLARPEDLPVNFSGTQVLRVSKDPRGILGKLVEKLGLDVLGGNEKLLNIRVPAELVESVKNKLKENKISFQTVIKDLQAAINKEKPIGKNRRSGMSWDQYHTLDTIYDYMETLARNNPSFVSVGVIGKSVENRPIKYIKISSGKPNAKAVFVEGGIHPREWVSTSSVTYLINELVGNRRQFAREVQELDFYLAPVVNPDGYAYTHTHNRMWRKNRSREGRCSGVDLNRNFDYKWGGKGTSGDTCSESYRGRSPASEPEIKALQNFLRGIGKNLKGYISFHAFGQLIMAPYGYDYNSYGEGYAEMKRVGDEAASAIVKNGGPRYTVGNIAHVIYPAAGSSVDWVKANLQTPIALAVELRDSMTSTYQFLLPPRFIIPTGKDALEILKAVSAASAKS